MNAEFFALAIFAALNPKLLAIDLLLIENRRPPGDVLVPAARRHDRGPDDRASGRSRLPGGSGVAMAGRGRPGRAPQVEKREQFARLIAQGFSNSEACRIVGINRRTGKRWRHGRTVTARDGRKLHYAPVAGAGRREISPRYLSEDERIRIADLRRAGAGVRAIAGQTGRSPSTISRELRRNRDPGSGQYRPFTAHKLAVRRRARPRAGKIARDEVLRQFVQDRLAERWSPEQI